MENTTTTIINENTINETRKHARNEIENNLKEIKGYDEDGNEIKIEGRSGYAYRLYTNTLKANEYDCRGFVKTIAKKYRVSANEKGFTIYLDKVRTLDVKVLNGKVKIFNHINLDEIESTKDGEKTIREYLNTYVDVNEALPTYKTKLFTNCVYVDNKRAFSMLKYLLARS